MGKLRVLSSRGDDEHVFDSEESKAGVAELYQELTKKGMVAFAKTPDGHEKIKEFDPNAEEILMVRPLVGG